MNGKLEIRLLNYFLLIAFAAMLVGVEFFFEMNQKELSEEIYSYAMQQKGNAAASAASSPLVELRNKIVIMFGVLTFVVAIVLSMFIKQITMPLCKMAEVAQRINQGDLRQQVPIESRDEIGQVGEAINELSNNLQEIAIFTSSTANYSLNHIDVLIEDIRQDKLPGMDTIQEIKSCILTLNNIIDTFNIIHPDSYSTK